MSDVYRMPSPFPSVDPYVENPEFWFEVHNRLIVAITDRLASQLRPKYRVAIEKRTYFSNDSESLLVGIADVAVLTRRLDTASPPNAIALIDRHKPPVQVAVPMPEEIRKSYLEIREVAGGQVVTVLKLLSEPEPEVDLQMLFDAVYDRAGLDLVIDYAQPPILALPEKDAVWVDSWLQENGFRD